MSLWTALFRPNARSAYRLEVTGGQTGELLTNPIYVEVKAPIHQS